MALTALVYLFWSSDVVWPLRILIVLFHELSHAFVALLTGGEVIDLTLFRREGGAVTFRGGNFFWTATAGYLGSLLIGVGLMIGAVFSRADRAIVMGLGAVILLTALLYVRDGFALIYMVGTGAAFLGVGWFLPHQVCDLLLRVIGLLSMIYVPWDIAVDTVFTANRMSLQVSDAAAIASRVWLTEGIVGTIWILLSLLIIAATARLTLRSPSNIAFGARDKGR